VDPRARRVLVTGASGGLGQAIVRGFAARGAQLVVSGRRAGPLERLAAEIGARVAVADLADPEALRGLARAHADIDVLVANAAIPASGPLETFAEAEIDRALDVNLRAPIVLARELAPAMAARGGGHLVFVGSLAGKAATEGASLYSATKFGLRGFAAALRAELHGTGVGVSAVFPGFIREAGMFADSGARLPPGVGTRTPQDVAAGVLRAVERDRAEVDVAPVPLRVGAILAGLAPDTAARLTRRLGGRALAARMAEGQAGKR
jgi:short-subunit dehydrogenase